MNRYPFPFITHFVEEFWRLQEILQEGFVPNYHLEDLTLKDGGGKFLGIPMVSFSDFPLEYASRHSGQYGKYCIALTKEWAMCQQNLNPVCYVTDEDFLRELISLPIDCLGYFKKYTSPWNGNSSYVNYDEGEWRYIVLDHVVPWMKTKAEYDVWRGDTNLRRPRPIGKLVENTLRFTADDIAFILVKTDQEKSCLIKQMQDGAMLLAENKIFTTEELSQMRLLMANV